MIAPGTFSKREWLTTGFSLLLEVSVTASKPDPNYSYRKLSTGLA